MSLTSNICYQFVEYNYPDSLLHINFKELKVLVSKSICSRTINV